jgi:hypothetical protein
MNSYAVGNLVRVRVAFADSQDAAVDPDVVKVQVRTPAGTISTQTYGTDSEVVRASAGSYYMDVDAESPGEWLYRWYSTGTGQAAAEGVFTVEASVFTEVET